jgi:hypothetical protein
MPNRRSRTHAAASSTRGRKIRYAVVGLGYISQAAVLLAFRHARRNSVLAARRGPPVSLAAFERAQRPTMAMEMRRPPVPSPRLVHAATPLGSLTRLHDGPVG